MTIIEKFGGRKFILSALSTILLFVLVLASKVDADEFLKVVFGIVAVYTGTNSISKFGKPVKKTGEEILDSEYKDVS